MNIKESTIQITNKILSDPIRRSVMLSQIEDRIVHLGSYPNVFLDQLIAAGKEYHKQPFLDGNAHKNWNRAMNLVEGFNKQVLPILQRLMNSEGIETDWEKIPG